MMKRLLAIAAISALTLPVRDAGAAALVTLHSFYGGADGAFPIGPTVYRYGMLYGTTSEGGTGCGGYGCGTVFSIDTKTLAETVLYRFAGGPDGASPEGGLIYQGGRLYGTTEGGGASGNGTVFEVDPATGAETVLYSFKGGSDGAGPLGSLLYHDGVLYGTTFDGGAARLGTVFTVDPRTGAEHVVHSFEAGGDGAHPRAGLTDVGGVLYGTTDYGGGASQGTVFSVDPGTRSERVVYSFAGGLDGAFPSALLTNQAGTLFGTTDGGGTFGHSVGNGTAYALDPASGAETVLHSFHGSDAPKNPLGGVTYRNGYLYFTTEFGGTSYSCGLSHHAPEGCGTLIKVNSRTGASAILHDFDYDTDGAYPTAPLLYADGAFYGTTGSGGASYSALGTVFKFTP